MLFSMLSKVSPVFHEELIQLANVLIYSHAVWYIEESRRAMRMQAIKDVLRVLQFIILKPFNFIIGLGYISFCRYSAYRLKKGMITLDVALNTVVVQSFVPTFPLHLAG